MRIAVDEVNLYFDVDGCGLVARGEAMVPQPTLVLLHGGPGADHSLFKPEFERRGGPVAREAAARFLGGDTSPAAAEAWAEHGLPLYAGAKDGGMAARRARALINEEVQTHFRAAGCGPAEITEAQAASVVSPTLILAGEDDPVSPAAGARRLAAALTGAAVQLEILPGVGHGVFRQAPQEAFTLLRAFLSGTGPG
ncbi:alpha/beta fold hydrolase [Streptacidiphilus sp. PAMC 29251]